MCKKDDKDRKDDDCEECQQRQFLKNAIVVAIVLWFVNLGLALFFAAKEQGEGFGQFGDSFGMVNALFSSVAVAGAIYAVILQQREIANSRIAQERNEEIQSLSTVLPSILHEMDFLHSRHAAVHAFFVKVARFLHSYEVAIDSRNLPSNVQDEALELLAEAESLDLILVQRRPTDTRHHALADEMIDLKRTINGATDHLSFRRKELYDRRETISKRLEELTPPSAKKKQI